MMIDEFLASECQCPDAPTSGFYLIACLDCGQKRKVGATWKDRPWGRIHLHNLEARDGIRG